jgi:hypothetical protein
VPLNTWFPCDKSSTDALKEEVILSRCQFPVPESIALPAKQHFLFNSFLTTTQVPARTLSHDS